MTSRERSDATIALICWFQSQNIKEPDAARICAELCGTLATRDKHIKSMVSAMRERFEAINGSR